MRWRNSYVWGFLACAVLALLLVLAGNPGFAASPPAGMSAPKPPTTSIESAPADKLLQPQSDWHGDALRPAAFSLAPSSHWRPDERPRYTITAAPHYGPLYRRPPPSFS